MQLAAEELLALIVGGWLVYQLIQLAIIGIIALIFRAPYMEVLTAIADYKYGPDKS